MAPFSVVAIVAAYNEADIIDQVVTDLIRQDVSVYFIDDGSTDATIDIVRAHLDRGVIGIEQTRPGTDDSSREEFDWTGILDRKAQLASDLQADWFIHNDADEFRESPWPGMTLASAIQRVDALGYNAIDSVRLDFWPVHDDFQPGDDVRSAFPFYAEPAPYDRLQVRCWKKTTTPVDLSSSGGHEVQFPERNVFPLPFLLRHYPIRSQAHGLRKVFRERRSRFTERERAIGWHVQYDTVDAGTDFIRDPATLTRFDAEAVRIDLSLRHRGLERLTTLEHEHESLRASFASQAELLSVARAETDSLRQELDGQRQELNAIRRERDDLTETSTALRQELDERGRHLAETHNAVADLTGRLNAMHQSKIWRWTAPLRALLDFVAGR
jgi:hypothetical protein